MNQGHTSSGPLIHHVIKEKRGRPRKDRSLQTCFGGDKEHIPQTSDTKEGFDPVVGQPVTGNVEATFDAGYLLNVKIGNSTANLRGLVFKPGCYAPVTPENDIAPHMLMITPRAKQGWSQNPNQSTQIVRTKRKYTSRRRGNLVPSVTQPVNLCNETSNQISRAPQLMHSDDEDVHKVEPLSVLPPDRSVPISQLFVGRHRQASTGPQLSDASGKDESGPCNNCAFAVGRGEKEKPIKFKDGNDSKSSQATDVLNGNGEDESKSTTEDPRVVSKIEDGNNTMPFTNEPTNFTNSPLFSCGLGKMTELLQAVQENAKDIQAQQSAASAFVIEVSEAKQGTLHETITP